MLMSLVFDPSSHNECGGTLEPQLAQHVVAGGTADDQALRDLCQLFKLLADETRLKILTLLRQTDELNVLELCSRLNQRQPSVSHHLALLRAAGLIDMRRDGKHNYYRVLLKRFEELIGLLFSSTQGEPQRIRFEDFELRYTPIQPES
jgi:ArsR family transcriptional regulator